MIYLHIKVIDNQNLDYIYENPAKNEWALIKDSVTINKAPTRALITQYRQCLFGNEAFVKLLDMFNVAVQIPNLSYTLSGYASEVNKDKVLEFAKEILKACKVLIIYDLCKDTDNEIAELKQVMQEMYPTDYEQRIYNFSTIERDKDKIKEILNKGGADKT